MERIKKQHLNIYKVKDSSIEFDDLCPNSAIPSFEIENEGNISPSCKYRLYIQRDREKNPGWYEFLKPVINRDNPILNRVSSFILFITQGDKKFILTGGFGHTKIKHLIDDEFGLSVALRVMEKTKIQAILQKPMKGQTRQIFRLVAGYDPSLDMDNYNRILKSIDGTSVDENLPNVKVSGKASLSLNVAITFEDLSSLLEKISLILLKDPKINFPKTYELVTSEDLKENLNDTIVKELNDFLNNRSDRDRLYIEFKDPLIQFQCSSFTIRIDGDAPIEFNDFSLEEVKNILIKNGTSEFDEINDLRGIKFSGEDDNGHSLFEDQSLKELLICEADLNFCSYIYIEKKWMKILDDLSSYVDEQLGKIDIIRDVFPDWNLSIHNRELQYNKAVANSKGFICLDQDLIRTPATTSIEVCDLYDKNENNFIHVKRTWGSKASYLFSQGLISASNIHQYQEFRRECISKWPDLFEEGFDKNLKVTYAIADRKASSSDFPFNLSFFAKLNLISNVSTINSFGYKVLLAPINIIPSKSKNSPKKTKQKNTKTGGGQKPIKATQKIKTDSVKSAEILLAEILNK